MQGRWRRLKGHIRRELAGTSGNSRTGINYPASLKWRLLETGFLLGDLFRVPETLMLLNRMFKPNTRRLTEQEINTARSIFGETIDYQKVRVDERSYVGCRKYRFAYVGFHYINSWGPLSDAHFIHEMVHVWQYQQIGSVYIPRALWAQRTPEGYDYGGAEALKRALAQGKTWQDFNYEQQGDIVADYFCLKNSLQPRWCEADTGLLVVFEAMVKLSS